MTNVGMATVKSIDGNKAIIELGSGEVKSASIPHNISILDGNKVLVSQVAGKYMIINIY